MRFFDTGILVNAATNQDERKRRIAIELIAHALEGNHDGVTSVQVMAEFVNTMLSKRLATKEVVDTWVSAFYPLLMTEITMDIVRYAMEIQSTCQIPFLDAQIVATAAKLHCHEIVSEDFDEKRMYEGVAIVNPFR